MNSRLQSQAGFGHLILLLVVITVAVISSVGFYVIKNHKNVSNLQTGTNQAESTSDLSIQTPDTVSPEQQVTPAEPSPTQSNKASSQFANTKPANTGQSTSPTPSASNSPKVSGTITFSADGCHVTATGTPGLLLTGLVMTSTRRKGGPMISPDGVKIPASGTITSLVAESGFDYSTYVVDAVLTDSSGATIAAQSTTITAHNCQ
jgi:hypothetical protein